MAKFSSDEIVMDVGDSKWGLVQIHGRSTLSGFALMLDVLFFDEKTNSCKIYLCQSESYFKTIIVVPGAEWKNNLEDDGYKILEDLTDKFKGDVK